MNGSRQLATLILAAFALACASNALVAEDWPQFLGPRGDGTSAETGIDTSWGKNGPEVLWSIEAGTGYGACSVASGRCYLFDRIDDQARLRCLEESTGEKVWEYTYKSNYVDSYGFDNGPRCSPIVDGKRVYIYGAEGKLHCVNATDGKKVWSLDVSSEYGVVQNFFGVGSTPVVDQDRLLVMVGGSPPDEQSLSSGELDRVTPDGNCLVAFHKETGEELYTVGDDLASYASIRLMRLEGEATTIAAVFARSGLLGFETATGKKRFEFPYRARKLESVNAASPVIRGSEIFLTESYELGGCLLKLVGDKPEVVWRDQRRKRSLGSHWMTPVLVGNHLYGCSGESNGDAKLNCVNWKTGEVAWSREGLSRHSILAVEGHLLVVNEFGNIWLIRATPEKFDVVAECENMVQSEALLERPVWAAPVAANGRLYLRGKSRLVCARLAEQL